MRNICQSVCAKIDLSTYYYVTETHITVPRSPRPSLWAVPDSKKRKRDFSSPSEIRIYIYCAVLQDLFAINQSYIHSSSGRRAAAATTNSSSTYCRRVQQYSRRHVHTHHSSTQPLPEPRKPLRCWCVLVCFFCDCGGGKQEFVPVFYLVVRKCKEKVTSHAVRYVGPTS